MYRGKVTQVDSSGVWVTTADYGLLGPCQAVVANYAPGDMVLCVNVGDEASPELVVVGQLSAAGSAASIPDGSITSAKIANGTIVDEDVSSSAAISRSKISGLPTSSTDNTVARYDGTGGALQGSGVTISDADAMTVPGNLTVQKATAPEFKLRSTGAEIYNTIDTYTSYYNDIKYRGSIRWSMYLVNANNWTLRRYNDAGSSLGDALTIYRADGKVRIGAPAAGLEYGSDGPRDMAGSGSPEGVVSAPVGSTWRRTNGGAGTTFWVKESGTGNTGWVAK